MRNRMLLSSIFWRLVGAETGFNSSAAQRTGEGKKKKKKKKKKKPAGLKHGHTGPGKVMYSLTLAKTLPCSVFNGDVVKKRSGE